MAPMSAVSDLVREAFRTEERTVDWQSGVAGALAAVGPLAIGLAVDEPAAGFGAALGGLNIALCVPRADLRARLVELEQKAAPLTLEFSVSPGTTIERFASGAGVVLVAAGADGRIKAIVSGDGRAGAAGSIEGARAAIEAELQRALRP